MTFDGTNLIVVGQNTQRIYIYSGLTSTLTNSYSALVSGVSGDPKGLTFTGGGVGGTLLWTDAFTPFTPSDDKLIFKTFTLKSSANWRLKFTIGSTVPYIGIVAFGVALEMPRFPISSGFSPDIQSPKVSTSRSMNGTFLGDIYEYTQREINPFYKGLLTSFINGDFKTFWDNHGKLMKPFFLAWNYNENPNDVYLVSFKDNFKMQSPYAPVRANLKLNLIGMVED